ncbi:Hypothetical predicted protein [Mytilus galloprovincialis]|nr:Hypothetical predicted protein [Mytilus galloprovincialis]
MFSIILVLLAAVTLVNGATIGVSDATTKMYASTMPDCSDKLDSCFDFSDGSCVGRYAPWARENCAYRCGYCPGNYPPCQDQITYCKELGSEVCNQKLYAGYVRLNCRETCNKCEIPALTYVPGNDTDVLPTGLFKKKKHFRN